MPIIDVKMVSGKTHEQKDQLIRALTESTAQILDLDPSKIIVVLNEHSPESWAVGGKKVSEMKK